VTSENAIQRCLTGGGKNPEKPVPASPIFPIRSTIGVEEGSFDQREEEEIHGEERLKVTGCTRSHKEEKKIKRRI